VSTAFPSPGPGGGTSAEPRRLAIRGIHHITLICASAERATAFYRDLLGLRLLEEGTNLDDPGARHLYFGDAEGSPGTVITVMEYAQMDEGVVGRGSTHHFALLVETAEELEGWRHYLQSRGVGCTEVLDRQFFKSVYLRDPDGHIVELATRAPGFTG
jgi:catechol 2,3-dioxygenase-like lactoylglutathione lyase family enzyme